MNTQRMLILGVAAVAAGAAALLARGLMGGGTQTAKAAPPPPRLVTAEVLVAATNLQPGTALTAAQVRWQEWPKNAVDSSFITHEATPDLGHVIQGTVVRAPLVAGEPLATTKFVHADAAGVMAAMVTPGMRAMSTSITTDNDAGGFILPNDRVDVMVTGSITGDKNHSVAITFMRDVRVLAVDQTYSQDKDQKTLLAKTVTLEVTPLQAQLLATAQAKGPISLALRALGDSGAQKTDKAETASDGSDMGVRIIGYGLPRGALAGQEN
jgi:pilus assembly protein CpaB